jgi:hypothetical protein
VIYWPLTNLERDIRVILFVRSNLAEERTGNVKFDFADFRIKIQNRTVCRECYATEALVPDMTTNFLKLSMLYMEHCVEFNHGQNVLHFSEKDVQVSVATSLDLGIRMGSSTTSAWLRFIGSATSKCFHEYE